MGGTCSRHLGIWHLGGYLQEICPWQGMYTCIKAPMPAPPRAHGEG